MAVRKDVDGLGWIPSTDGGKGAGTLIGAGTAGSTGTGGAPTSDTDFLRRRKNEGFFVMTDWGTCCGSGAVGGGSGFTGADTFVLLAFELVVLTVAVELELPPPPNTRLKNPGRPDLLDPPIGGVVVGAELAKAGSGGRAIGAGGGWNC
jgi:hypothetical protein